MHSEVLAEKQGGCAVPVLVGEPETGTLAMYIPF